MKRQKKVHGALPYSAPRHGKPGPKRVKNAGTWTCDWRSGIPAGNSSRNMVQYHVPSGM